MAQKKKNIQQKTKHNTTCIQGKDCKSSPNQKKKHFQVFDNRPKGHTALLVNLYII